MEQQYTKAQLRELVVSYYALVDPQGMNQGVDINGSFFFEVLL